MPITGIGSRQEGSLQIKDLYRSVTDAIVAELEAGAVPWVRPWKGTNLMPTNAVTKKRYNGINIPILWYTAEKRGYEHHLWCTYRQALEIGAQVRKGEQAAHIVYTSTYTKVVDDEAATARFLKSHILSSMSRSSMVIRCRNRPRLRRSSAMLTPTRSSPRPGLSSCQFALNSDPHFAPNNDPVVVDVRERPEAMREAVRRSAAHRRRAPYGMWISCGS